MWVCLGQAREGVKLFAGHAVDESPLPVSLTRALQSSFLRARVYALDVAALSNASQRAFWGGLAELFAAGSSRFTSSARRS